MSKEHEVANVRWDKRQRIPLLTGGSTGGFGTSCVGGMAMVGFGGPHPTLQLEQDRRPCHSETPTNVAALRHRRLALRL